MFSGLPNCRLMQCDKMRDQIVHNSFDHLVGERKQLIRDGETQHLCGFGVDDELDFGRLQNWQIRRVGTFENLSDINTSL
jgi:hypothetical protein